MEIDQYIPADEFCINCNVEHSFVMSLHHSGLIEITTVEQKSFIRIDQLRDVEKFARLHYELDINLEGIEAIHHLLKKMKAIQEEVALLRSRLYIYESNMDSME